MQCSCTVKKNALSGGDAGKRNTYVTVGALDLEVCDQHRYILSAAASGAFQTMSSADSLVSLSTPFDHHSAAAFLSARVEQHPPTSSVSLVSSSIGELEYI